MGRCVGFFTFAVLCRDAVCDTTVAGSLSRMLFQFNLLKKKKSLIALCKKIVFQKVKNSMCNNTCIYKLYLLPYLLVYYFTYYVFASMPLY